jgi:hypothetical protein
VGLAAACGRLGFDVQPVDVSDATVADDTSDAMSAFVDPFDRTDSTALGNSWEEKTPGTYAIVSGHVVRTDFSLDYRNDIAVRPVAEDLRDVEVSIEFTVSHLPPGFPQVEARIQRTSLSTLNTLDGYLLYIEGTTGNGLGTAALTRQHGTTLPAPLMTFVLNPELALGETYRLRLAVRGASPVVLDGFVELKAGTNWTVIGSVSTTDSAINAVVTTGALGFATGQPEATGYYTYDEFSYRPL